MGKGLEDANFVHWVWGKKVGFIYPIEYFKIVIVNRITTLYH